jgi:hypothetical protein
MTLAQEIKFALQLSLSESYISGTASTDDRSYSINVQQGANQLIVLPQDFSYIGEPNQSLVSFGRDEDNNSKRISDFENKNSIDMQFSTLILLLGCILYLSKSMLVDVVVSKNEILAAKPASDMAAPIIMVELVDGVVIPAKCY